MNNLTYIKPNDSDFYCDNYNVMMNRLDCSNCKAYKNCSSNVKV